MKSIMVRLLDDGDRHARQPKNPYALFAGFIRRNIDIDGDTAEVKSVKRIRRWRVSIDPYPRRTLGNRRVSAISLRLHLAAKAGAAAKTNINARVNSNCLIMPQTPQSCRASKMKPPISKSILLAGPSPNTLPHLLQLQPPLFRSA